MPFKPPPNVNPLVCECGDHAWFLLTRGYVCIVDANLAPAFACWPWHALIDHGNVYAARSSEFQHRDKRYSHKFYAHQMVLATPRHLVADHINGNGLDNRRANLRALTPEENTRVRKKNPGSSSRYRGVSARNGKWFAYIRAGGKQVSLGLFDDEAEAAQARSAAEVKFYGYTDNHGGSVL